MSYQWKSVYGKRGGNYQGLTKNYDGRLAIAAIQTTNGRLDGSVGLLIDNCNGKGNYILNKPKSLWYQAFHDRNLTPLNATVTITKFERGEDKINNLRWLIISGTFKGILLPEGRYTDTVKITEGRFDVKFQ